MQVINNEILNSTYDKQRNKRKHKTRFLTKKQNRNIENMKTFSNNNETLRRKNRFFLTTHANQNFFVNKEFPFFNNSRNKILSIYKRNILMNEFNTFHLKDINNSNNKKYKIYNSLDLVKQKKISFHIFPKINALKFKETSQFLNRINNSFKEKNVNKKLLKEIIINYQKNHNERKINSLYFPEIYNFNINTISHIKRTKYDKRNVNKSMNNNIIFTSKGANVTDIFKIEKIIKQYKKIKI